jgi:putative hydrolase of the HAD superfamily
MQTLCLVFDIDDTLYLERDYAYSGFKAVGSWAQTHLGIEGFAENATQLFQSGARRSIFQQAFDRVGISPDQQIVETMVQVYRNHFPDIEFLPDAAACLQKFKPTAAMAVITDGPEASQRNKYQKLGLREFCPTAIFTGEWGEEFSKPHLRSFQAVEDQVGKGNHRFVYVADNPAKDFIAPNRLGWDTIRIRRPEGLHFHKEPAPSAQARVEVSNLSQLAEVLEVRLHR